MSIKGGVDIVQFREKKLSDELFLDLAQNLKIITKKYNIPLIINDRFNIANKISSNLHIVQSDLSLINELEPFENYKKDKMIGMSISNEDQLINLPKWVDYIGVGPIFNTKTKLDAGPCLGLNGLIKIKQKTKLPIIAIGGIKEKTIKSVMSCGIAVIGELMDANNTEQHAKFIKKIMIECF